jgi:aldehyde:ferredoxin oxidoreductase
VRDIIEALRAATGWDITLDELQQVGERATNLARLFNLREGFTSAMIPCQRDYSRRWKMVC